MPPRGVPTSVDSSVHLPAHALMAPLRVVVSFEASMRWCVSLWMHCCARSDCYRFACTVYEHLQHLANCVKLFRAKRPGTNSKALATCKSAFYLKMADALRRSKAVERARPLQDALEVQLRHTNVLFHIVIGLERVSLVVDAPVNVHAVCVCGRIPRSVTLDLLSCRLGNLPRKRRMKRQLPRLRNGQPQLLPRHFK